METKYFHPFTRVIAVRRTAFVLRFNGLTGDAVTVDGVRNEIHDAALTLFNAGNAFTPEAVLQNF